MLNSLKNNFTKIVNIKARYTKYNFETNYYNCLFLKQEKDKKDREIIWFLDGNGIKRCIHLNQHSVVYDYTVVSS